MEDQQLASPAVRPSTSPCVAVLPLANLSDDPEEDYLCEGLAAEILVCLARTPGVRVVARSSVFALDWDQLDVRDTGKRLCATAILQGSVHHVGSRLEVSVKLTDVSSGQTLWSDSFDRDMVDVFVVQDEIVAGVVRALPISVEDSRVQKIVDRHARNVEAYTRWFDHDSNLDSLRDHQRFVSLRMKLV